MRPTVWVMAAVLAVSLSGFSEAGNGSAESRTRRFETVFMISLPFTALYSGLLTMGAAAVVEVGIKGDSLTMGPAYQIAAMTLAVAGAALIARKDMRTATAYPGPSGLRAVERGAGSLAFHGVRLRRPPWPPALAQPKTVGLTGRDAVEYQDSRRQDRIWLSERGVSLVTLPPLTPG